MKRWLDMGGSATDWTLNCGNLLTEYLSWCGCLIIVSPISWDSSPTSDVVILAKVSQALSKLLLKRFLCVCISYKFDLELLRINLSFKLFWRCIFNVFTLDELFWNVFWRRLELRLSRCLSYYWLYNRLLSSRPSSLMNLILKNLVLEIRLLLTIKARNLNSSKW